MIFPLLLLALLPLQEPESDAPKIYPLALEDVVRLVQANAPALHQARLTALAAQGSVLEAGGAFSTVLFADFTYSYEQTPASGFFTGFGDTQTRQVSANEGLRKLLSTGGTLTLSTGQSNLDADYLTDSQSDVNLSLRYEQPLLRGGWELSATRNQRRAEFERDRTRAASRQSNVQAVQDAVDAYWNLAFAHADVEVKAASLRLAEELREMTQAKFDVGAVAEVEVVQTEADIASRTDALLAASNQVNVAQDQLRLLLFGLEDVTEWEWQLMPRSEVPKPDGVAVDWQKAFEVARRYRGDLREMRVIAQRSRNDWQAARKDLLPKLDFIATGNLSEQDELVVDAASDLFDYDFPGYSVGLVFEMPLGNAQYEGAEQRLRYEHQLSLRQLRDRENQVAREVRDAVRDLSFQAERVAVTRRAREVAGRQLDAEQRRLLEGASTNFQVLQFQTDLSIAASQEVQAQMDYAKAVVKAHTVRGLNWDGSRPALAGLGAYTPGSEFSN